MKNDKLDLWLAQRGLVLEEDFASAFQTHAIEYKKKRGQKPKGCLCPLGNHKTRYLQMAKQPYINPIKEILEASSY